MPSYAELCRAVTWSSLDEENSLATSPHAWRLAKSAWCVTLSNSVSEDKTEIKPAKTVARTASFPVDKICGACNCWDFFKRQVTQHLSNKPFQWRPRRAQKKCDLVSKGHSRDFKSRVSDIILLKWRHALCVKSHQHKAAQELSSAAQLHAATLSDRLPW